jgi:heme exporter protein A
VAEALSPAIDFDRVRVAGVTKVFGPTRALSGVTLDLPAQSVTVLRGQNGSGKSTLLAILSTLMRPTGGTVSYGKATAESGGAGLRARIGVVSHASMLYPDLTPRENLELRARLYGIGGPPARAEEAIGAFELRLFADRPCRTLSRGQLQRVALAAALLPRPRLLLLDEPTTGLDLGSVDLLCGALDKVRTADETIVVLSTHDPAMSDRIADRVVTLERGGVAGIEERAGTRT